jgi:hypothetical protein
MLMLSTAHAASTPAPDSPPGETRRLEIRLADGTTIVASEGLVEPRSIGSVTIAAYGAADPEFRYDDFQSGIVWPRDGTLLRVLAAEIDTRPGEEVIVITQSAGSGGYLSATAFRWQHGVLAHVASVEGLPPTGNAVEALIKAAQKR